MQRFISILFIGLCFVVTTVVSQVRPVNDYGALGLGQLLKRLNTTASVMMIGAHPDDEDSALLAYLARGENARTAYLSLTRGDGGQNIIGPELFESLGIIRTEELLQARRLDGAEQYFTRAFDYGFSKTLAEAKQKWDEKVIVCDTVRAIRTFRPLVVISRFSGTPADGHGQHQYSGYITPIAVKAAADPKQCAGAGEPWQILKFYVEQGFGDNGQTTIRMNTGAYDPNLGRSYFEIAMEGRSQHRSQGEGRIEFHGEQFSGISLVSGGGSKSETSPFDGLDTTIKGIAKLTGDTDEPTAAKLADLQRLIESATSKYRPFSPNDILHDLAAAARLEKDMELSTRNPGLKEMLSQVGSEINNAIARAAGVEIDALSDKELVVSGDDLTAAVKVYFPKSAGITIKDTALKVPSGWDVTKTDAPKDNTPGFMRREAANSATFFNVKVPRDAKATQPYWLDDPRDGDLFRWPNDANQNLPFQPPLVTAIVKIEIDGTEISLKQAVQYRFADPARGEIRRELNVIPSLSVSLDRNLLVVPLSDKPQTRRVTMSITNNSSKPISGVTALNTNAANEWKYVQNSATFNLKNKGEKTNVAFDVTIPAKTPAGTYHISGNAMVGEALATQTMTTIAYPHIQTHRFYTRAETVVDVLDLKPAAGKVGYIMGSGDDVPEAIRQIGFDVTMLEEKDLASGDLSKFDSIVVGIRASETRPDFVANNQRLLDYVKNGGNLIVQYQRPSFARQNLTPYPMSMEDTQRTTAGTIARVVDENAKVTILQPEHPIFNFPNKITAKDFDGWVQERNAYNFTTFDAQYTPLLESHDAGENENKGGLVIARVGKGNYIYCSYSFFRQLPAGVGGAYRLFANMLSLAKSGSLKK